MLLIAGLALIGLAGETWLRSKGPFMISHYPNVFVADVGLMLPPRTEVRWTNRADFWTVSRTNSLGFLDREPPSPERAAESCHVAVIGDSYVAAKEVPISEKFHVRLEEMAARELPALDVTTSAFGRGSTGQINQLAYYDEYARHLRPRLIVLIFLPNDFRNNFPLLRFMANGATRGIRGYVSAERAEDGGFRLRPPDPDYRRFTLPRPKLWNWHWAGLTVERSPWFWAWLKSSTLPGPEQFSAVWEEEGELWHTETLAFTAFALDEFKKRAERDGAALVILAAHRMVNDGDVPLAWLSELAAERRIPVVDQADFINRQGAELRDAEWTHDGHWNLAGHRWAAEALLEYLKQNQELCE